MPDKYWSSPNLLESVIDPLTIFPPLSPEIRVKAANPMNRPLTSGEKTLLVLSKSDIYQDYERAFTAGTGLPLLLHSPGMLKVITYASKRQNPFCTIMGEVKESGAASYTSQCQLEENAQFSPKTVKCLAGLCNTAVPVRAGENLIGFLQTGQILLHQPEKCQFERVAGMLLKWGAVVDLKKLKDAYFHTRVFAPKQYAAIIQLLEIFAKHLGTCSHALVLKSSPKASPIMTRARIFIAHHSDDEISLTSVARTVNMSATYFSGKFKEATGINFVEYVARTRIEKARNLLRDPDLRISEIAFSVGFHSLSQFNRTFRNVVGESPRMHRTKSTVH